MNIFDFWAAFSSDQLSESLLGGGGGNIWDSTPLEDIQSERMHGSL